MEKYPHVNISIESQATNHTLEMLEAKKTDLGLVAIENYDAENGLLAVDPEVTDKLFQVTDETIITFLDLDEETITKKTASILGSTSKLYRCNDNKDMPLLAFIASTEIKKEDEIEEAKIIVIVRYDRLDNAGRY